MSELWISVPCPQHPGQQAPCTGTVELSLAANHQPTTSRWRCQKCQVAGGFDADGNLLLVWTIWKHSAEREGDWQAVIGLQGDKMTALRTLEDCERLVSDERYQYMAMPGDERPKQTLRGANQAPRGLRGGF